MKVTYKQEYVCFQALLPAMPDGVWLKIWSIGTKPEEFLPYLYMKDGDNFQYKMVHSSVIHNAPRWHYDYRDQYMAEIVG